MKAFLRISYLFIAILFSCSSGNHNSDSKDLKPEKLVIYAGAGLTDILNILNVLIDSFEVVHNVEIKINLASSGTLARQIELGAKPDIFISASKSWADYVDSLGLIVPNSKTTVAKNSLVMVAPKSFKEDSVIIDSTLDILKIIGEERLSMGDPAHVPAGKYAQEALKYYGWYESVKSKILPTKDVRSALMVVELGETPFGIVYKTDALRSDKVKIVGTFSPNSHKPIVFISCICSNNPLSKKFVDYLNSASVLPIWLNYGFVK